MTAHASNSHGRFFFWANLTVEGEIMTDEEFIESFENCTLPRESFHHHDHVKLAWLYLRSYPVLEALARFSEGLKRFASFHGKSNLYHETITWAYIFIIRERMTRATREETWEDFADRNADLLNWGKSILKRYYREATLQSDLARKLFVFPDNCDKDERPRSE
jgi:hypothetical protein